MTSSSSYSVARFASRWTHSSRGAPLLRVVPGRHRAADDLGALRDCEESASIAIEWLEQSTTTLSHDAHGAALRTIGKLTGELHTLHAAAARVRIHSTEPALASFFGKDDPLHTFLVEVHSWSERVCASLEEIAVALRRGEPARSIFLHRAINESYASLETRLCAARDHVARAMLGPASAARALEADLEEALWATTWLHLSLTQRFGE